jgi:hypothetical protein
MSKASDLLMPALKRLNPIKYKFNGQISTDYINYIDQGASDLIYDGILADKPLMVARFGSVELNCMSNYLGQKERSTRYLDYLTNKSRFFKWKKDTADRMCTFAGFFPYSFALLDQFCELMINDLKYIDILGSWLKEEALFTTELKNVKKIGFLNLEPYNHVEPWSRALEGLKVLVVHPFTESIIQQYKNRSLLFSDPRVLPNFELKTVKAVQSIANNITPYKTWFEALNSMKEQIDHIDFDVAIIGCGAYGLPLAAHVKRSGKKAVHLGGATQVLFGIRGKRWEAEGYGNGYNKNLLNSNWVRPLESEVPGGFQKVENGCYW